MPHNILDSLDLDIPSPIMEAVNQLLDSQNSILTPQGVGTSNGSSSNSPQQSTITETLFLEDFEYPVDFTEFLQNYPGGTLPQLDNVDTPPAYHNEGSAISNINILPNISDAENGDRLKIIAQPNESYRLRYATDSKTANGQGHRFIRTGLADPRYEYPTVQFSRKWCDLSRELYIKVTPVTITTDKIREHYIHPYKIGAEGNDFIDDGNNSLYFPIQPEEFNTCEKKFQITQTVMLQKNLKEYGPLRKYETNLFGNQHVPDIGNPKEIIATYQLHKFQFIFAIAERTYSQPIPITIPHTAIESKIMVGEEADKKQLARNHANHTALNLIKCIPRKAQWQDGEEIAITMAHSIKNKTYSIIFDFPLTEPIVVTNITPIDQKTFCFFAPACPFPVGNHDLTVRMVINENDIDLGYIDFIYIRPVKVTMIACPNCQPSMMARETDNSNKRPRESNDVIPVVEAIVSGMREIILDEKESEPSLASTTRARMATTTTTDDSSAKFDKYLNQLQEALVAFVRTNDPSKLFRRTRVLLSTCDENPPPLHDAIEHGYIPLVSTIIQQVANMREPNNLLEKRNENGETVLLVGARCNEWKVIELIVKEREDVIEAKDNDGNNMLHLLANVKEDAGAETLKNLLEILPIDVKMRLLKEENKKSQVAKDIAQSHENTQCLSLLSKAANSNEINNYLVSL
ncbi:hypothetical protein I4U23_007144 [Adineta vaga]|nr:hypothetical protein I4U23_007144 [Adineta vaga]